MNRVTQASLATLFAAACSPAATDAGKAAAESADAIAATVAALDTEYQFAVKNNDEAAMDRILHDDFALVVGTGATFDKDDLLKSARDKTAIYEQQDEEPGSQMVRVYGDETAVVTAKLWLKGASAGNAFERKLWFTDTYVRTSDGWRYAFGQASLPLPAEAP